jgi:hypothetical protein
MGNKIFAPLQKAISEFMKGPKKKMRDWWGNMCKRWRKMCKRWENLKFKHPWRACLLQYGGLALLVGLVFHLSSILSGMANVDYFRYPLNETFRHPFNATANLTINRTPIMQGTEIYVAEMYADNVRSLLCTLVASEAAIVAIVVSLTLIAIELTASEYSPRVIKVSLRNPDMWILLLIYGVSIFYAIVLLKQLPYDSWIPYDDVSFAFWFGVFSYAALVPYLWNIPQLLDPTHIVKRVSADIEKDTLLKYITVLKKTSKEDETNTSEGLHQSTEESPKETSMTNGDTEGHEENPIQPILDIVYRSINNYDLETVRNGLEQIAKLGKKVIDAYNQDNALGKDNEKLLKKRFSQHFCDPLKRISGLAASKDDEGSTREVIKTLQTFGEKTADKQLKVATEQVAVTLGAVGEISARKGKAFEDAVSKVAKSLETVGKVVMEKKCLLSIDAKFEAELNNGSISEELKMEFKKNRVPLPDNVTVEKEGGRENKGEITDGKKIIIRKEDGKLNIYEKKNNTAVKQVASSLGTVGKAATDEGLEEATVEVVSSLEEVGKAAVDNEVENATKEVTSSLKAIGEAAVDKGKDFETVTTEVAIALKAVGVAAAEKVLEAATTEVAIALKAVGVAAAEKKLEDATGEAVTALREVETEAVNRKLKDATLDVVIALEAVGKVAAERKLKDVTSDAIFGLADVEEAAVVPDLESTVTRAADALKAVGNAAIKSKLEAATKDAVEALIALGKTAIEKNLENVIMKVNKSLAELKSNSNIVEPTISECKLSGQNDQNLQKFIRQFKDYLEKMKPNASE